ncbi:heterokaryon incompatibility protein-domain-containing protein [Fusarium redolens]|uniref:Heterokaryon incompatibility protein-domain-containing protein n=1 Tax=Fusarium redolens TaxID=48865 RepID=A0A9P9GJ39_FUSRE|nr:heterokaryon incompatibility protein-domain-containing protein [Fusarium redolens]KAH7240370.1 heterokaryon incompatibility protein-domain-containing protein [Fusarium redolens]
MGIFDYDTMSASDWVETVVIGMVWAPSAYFFNSWVKDRPSGALVGIVSVIFFMLQQSAENCHLCSLLWHSSFGAQTIPATGAYSEETIAREPDSTMPLLSAVASSRNSLPCEQGGEAAKLSVQISATRKFGREQLLHIRLYKKGSSPFPSLTIEDDSSVSHEHNCEQSNMTGSKPSFRWAREMVEKCEREHQNCRNHFIRSDSQRYLPKRLIDVRARDKGVIQLYAALSHCWGTTVMSELRDDNQETTKTILIEGLDPNFRDAVDITYKMGINYLWIDSLCIMQRSKEWEEQSGDMGLVYARAKVVISATASKNSQGGCYKPKDLFPYDCVLCSNWNCSLAVRSLTRYPDLVQLFDGKVDHSFLASRIVHFCSGLMLFECNTLTTSECHGEEHYPLNTQFSQDGTLNAPAISPPGPEPSRRLCKRTIIRHAGFSTRPSSRPAKDTVKKSWSANPEHRVWANRKRRYEAQVSSIRTNAARLSMRGAFGFLWSFRGQNMQEQAEFHLRWYEMVTSYSVRNLTNDGDKMMAIAGVAYFIQQSTCFKYAAGLWDETLPFNLLWVIEAAIPKTPSNTEAKEKLKSNIELGYQLQDKLIQSFVEDCRETDQRADPDEITTFCQNRAVHMESWSSSEKWVAKRKKLKLLDKDLDSLTNATKRLVGNATGMAL